MDRLVWCFPLCGRCAIVGGLRTASSFTAFALVVSVWPIAAVAAVVHGSSFSLLAGGSL